MTAIIETETKTALHPLKRKIPYGWDLNIYRGCMHGCRYCYAQYSHKYLEGEFFSDVYVKKNIAEALERELSSPLWKREVVNLGGVTDSYQPAEKTYRLMPDILRLMIKYKTPVIISSKSDLVLRDFDLIDELSRITYVNIAQTVTTADEECRTKIEPGASGFLSRIHVLKEFKKTNASTGLHMMPIIPFVTDDEKNAENIMRHAAECRVDYVLTGTLYLRGNTRLSFMEFFKKEFPLKYEAFLNLYNKGGADPEYKQKLYVMINDLRKKYNISSSYMKPMKEKLK